MPSHQRHQEPPESQDVYAVGTQAERDYADGTQPSQFLTEQERKKVREALRVLHKDAIVLNENYETIKPRTIEKEVGKVNRLHERARQGKDASLSVVDAKVVLTHVDTVWKMGKMARNQARTFEVTEFFDPLRQLLGLDDRMMEDLDLDEEDDQTVRRGGRLGDWSKIGWIAMQRGRRAPGVEFMNGMMAVEHKRRAVNRRAKQKQAVAPEVRPQEVKQGDLGENVNPTIRNTNLLEKELRKYENVNLFKWLINPRSFGQTVENTMYTSFLVNTGRAAIEDPEDGSGIPVIYACEPPTPEDRIAQYDETGKLLTEALTKRQVILEMNMQVWTEAIELFDIRTSVIPHREEGVPGEPGASGWYA
ncbi:hypothetical protein NCC49_001112 [Naganishia albida]|nr:hypothetical protein NCC49_001112 [Naganishia albida]